MPLLSLEKIVYVNQETDNELLKEITAEFFSGKVYGILGKNSVERKALLALMTGLSDIKLGRILFKGKEMNKKNGTNYRRKDISCIFQSDQLVSKSTVLDMLQMRSYVSQSSRKTTNEWTDYLKKVGLNKRILYKKTSKLSAAEQQRFLLANALLNSPDLLVINELPEVMSELSIEHVLTLLRTYAKNENKCIIISAASKDIAAYVDELWGLNRGKLLFIKNYSEKQ